MSVEDYLNDVHKDCSKPWAKLSERGLAEGVSVTPFYTLKRLLVRFWHTCFEW